MPEMQKIFWIFEHVIPEQRRKELRGELKKIITERIKVKDNSSSRATRMTKRTEEILLEANIIGSDGKELKLTQREYSFVVGLEERCPRCGFNPISDADLEIANSADQQSLIEHLENCNDKKVQKQYRKELRLKEQKLAQKKEKLEKQDQAQSLAAWKFAGSTKGSMWMLEEKDRKEQLLLMPAEAKTKKRKASEAQVIDLTETKRSKSNCEVLDLTVQSDDKVLAVSKQKKNIYEDLPENLHSLSRQRLLVVAKGHDIENPEALTNSKIIKLLQNF